MPEEKHINVYLIEHSDKIRGHLVTLLKSAPDIDLVGIDKDCTNSFDKIKNLHIDILLIDIDIPGISAFDFIKLLMDQNPLPIITFTGGSPKSKHIALQIMESGAIDFIKKPQEPDEDYLFELDEWVLSRIRIASKANMDNWKSLSKNKQIELNENQLFRLNKCSKVIIIGASTGGTRSVRTILEQLPSTMPPIIIIQNLPVGFSKIFADRLNDFSSLMVTEARQGDILEKNHVYIAKGDFHLKLEEIDGNLRIRTYHGKKVHFRRPSIDLAMFSAAENIGPNAIAIILTGNGIDGAAGLQAIKLSGGATIAQSEETCVISDIIKAAKKLDSVDYELPIDDIPDGVIRLLTQ